jgi:hypothetical protein
MWPSFNGGLERSTVEGPPHTFLVFVPKSETQNGKSPPHRRGVHFAYMGVQIEQPVLFIALFRCGTCNGPMLGHLLTDKAVPAARYSEAAIRSAPFPKAVCCFCDRTDVLRDGASIEKLFELEWEGEIRYGPTSRNVNS